MGGFSLRLYISGDTISSRRAKDNLARLCGREPMSSWPVEVIDVLSEPQRAEEAGILATPTLSCEHPTSPKRVVGDLSDTNRILGFLGITAKDGNE
ncbi:MAG TPA: circadian clock KaiB family protein [Gemmataceae bacterium]|nr:circadian clock KaiB family protein [Gemmataceae bacterium]